ncbi:hypothetical protein [Lacimicrobium alkaliphilum]|uniref:Uncharacterized protein n=1 Tax=Lacimicrobium alkaliphilum TaxID=1526571 RepID=A0A0U3BC63_9ALTE|nr:hypothetical protein [Lacimicrobium alkaliphilum]ALS99253.1 hypothetical protein AT746_13965 [Lacimicrobium alkaliphilum]
MLNKKILAAAIATAFTMNAHAVVKLDAAGTQADPTDTVVYASESITAGDINSDGLLEAGNAGNILDVRAEVGFTIGNGTSKYVRVELGGGAQFGAVPTLTTANASAAVSQGGTVGDDFVIFEVAATADVPAAQTYVVAATDYLLNASGTSTVAVATYETAADAVNETSALFTDSAALSTVVDVVTGDIVVPGESVATVGSDFLAFTTADGDAFSATVGKIGEIDVAEYISNAAAVNPAGGAVTAAGLLEQNQTVTVSGNFTFGAWELNDDLDCDPLGNTTALVINGDENAAATAAPVDVTTAPWAVCVTVNGTTDEIVKGSYSVNVDEDDITNTLGVISYDTTSIEVPYLTTFSAYNQRVYIVNHSANDAAYTMSFTSEDGTTATAGSAASGTVPAGEMVALKATDIVTLSGGTTRTSAVIEVEAVSTEVTAASQSVNLSDGTTDTVVLH